MTPIESQRAWGIVCAARHAQRDLPWQTRDGLRVARDGSWSGTAAVSEAAALLLDTLLPLACARGPLVVAQIGQSLDGHTATVDGHSHYITGEASRAHLHRLRALVDAVIVGVNTVIADDPRLTVRHVSGPSPARVVLDPHGRAPAQRALFQGEPVTWHAVYAGTPAVEGSRPLPLPRASGAQLLPALLQSLAAHGMRRVLVEGGAITISHFVAAGLLDRLHVVVAPFLMGSGKPALQLPPIATLEQALRPPVRCYRLGSDQLYDLDMRGCGGSASTST